MTDTTHTTSRVVALQDISILDDCRMRLVVRQDKVREYAGRIQDGSTPPPMELVELPDGRLIMVNGEHRFMAYQQVGRTEAECTIYQGTMTDAMIRAASADNDAPINRTADDKRNALRKLLAIPEVADQWSVARIARTIQVRRGMVREIAEEMYPGWIERERDVVVERDGKTFTMRSGGSDRRASTSELAADEPSEPDMPVQSNEDSLLDLDNDDSPPPPPEINQRIGGPYGERRSGGYSGGHSGGYSGNGSRPSYQDSASSGHQNRPAPSASGGYQPLDDYRHTADLQVAPDTITVAWVLPDGTEDAVSLGSATAILRIPPDVRRFLLDALRDTGM
jgi:hypothetical protein